MQVSSISQETKRKGFLSKSCYHTKRCVSKTFGHFFFRLNPHLGISCRECPNFTLQRTHGAAEPALVFQAL